MPRPSDRNQHRNILRVQDVMREVTEFAHPDHDLHEAWDRFDQAETSVLPVVDGDEIVGLLTIDAVLARLGQEAESSSGEAEVTPEAHVADIMVADLPICRPRESIDDVATAIGNEGRPALLVLGDDDELIGIVLRRDLERRGGYFPRAPGHGRAPEATAHTVRSPSRAPAGKPGQPKSYAVKPRIHR